MPGTSRALQVWLFVAGSAAAQVPPPRADYQVVPECPDEGWFLDRVAEQQVTAPSGGALALSVERSDEGFRAIASFTDATPVSVTWQRQLVDGDCETLLRAVALSLALHWEDEARANEARAAAEPAPTPLVPTTAVPTTVVPTTVAEYSSDSGPDANLQEKVRLRLLVGLGGGLQTGLSPQPEPLAALRVGIGGQGDHFGAGRFQVTFSAVPSDVTQSEIETATETIPWSSSWWALGLHACPWGKRFGSFVLSTCGDARLIRYQAVLFRSPTTSTTWVGTVGPALAATLELGPLGLQLDTGLDVPLAPADTEFQQRSVHRQRTGMHALVVAEVYPLSGP